MHMAQQRKAYPRERRGDPAHEGSEHEDRGYTKDSGHEDRGGTKDSEHEDRGYTKDQQPNNYTHGKNDKKDKKGKKGRRLARHYWGDRGPRLRGQEVQYAQ